MNTLRFSLSTLLFFVASATGAEYASAQVPFVNQVPEIKADSLAILGYYFKYPNGAIVGNSFVIGVLGEAPFPVARVTQRVKAVNEKQIVVHEFASAKDYRPCHILFVADQAAPNSDEKTAQARLGAVLPKTKDSVVLVVTETAGFAQRGALVNFVVDLVANRVVMEVNRDEAKRRGIGLTRGLLQLERTNKVRFLTDPVAAPAN